MYLMITFTDGYVRGHKLILLSEVQIRNLKGRWKIINVSYAMDKTTSHF